MDLHWRIAGRSIDERRVAGAASAVAGRYAGVRATATREAPDHLCVRFEVPGEEGRVLEIEISVYDLDRDGRVLSLEADEADNLEAWDDAAELAEELAERLDGRPLDL